MSSIRVLECDEGSILDHVGTAEGEAKASTAAGQAGGARSYAGGLFDVILLGGGCGIEAAEPVAVGGGEGKGKERRTPAERLDLVLDR